jgi:hypothetical protein
MSGSARAAVGNSARKAAVAAAALEVVAAAATAALAVSLPDFRVVEQGISSSSSSSLLSVFRVFTIVSVTCSHWNHHCLYTNWEARGYNCPGGNLAHTFCF